jgi:C-terminal processing protease CtpA/Prc
VLNGAQFPEAVSTPLYLSGALDLLQAEYLYSQRVDWARLKAASLSDLPDDASLDLAYERLEAALRAIGVQGRDGHSQLFRPNRVGRVMPLVGSGARYTRDGLVILVYPGSAAERGGVQVGDRIESIDGIGLYTLQSRIDNGLDSGAALPYAVTLWRDGRQQTVFVDFGGYTDLLPPVIQRFGSMVYIETFGTYGTGIDTPQYLDYLTDAHDRLSAAANAGATCGYVLDVRRNLGGVAFPVLLPMMPLVGSGLFGTAYRPEGQAVFFGRYDAETARITGGAITGNGRLLPRTPAVLDTSLPVAVLTSSATASMGEYSAVMLLGNPDRSVRIFGERTAGLASFLGFYTLADGGALWIARTLLTDRIGRSYLDGLTPDQPLAVDWARYATPTDPVLVAALGWLRAQGC